jgi:hypothetical protein
LDYRREPVVPVPFINFALLYSRVGAGAAGAASKFLPGAGAAPQHCIKNVSCTIIKLLKEPFGEKRYLTNLLKNYERHNVITTSASKMN